MKKVLAVALAAVMVLSLAACGAAPAAKEEAAPAATEAAKEEAKEEAAPAAEEAAPAAEAAEEKGPMKLGFCNMSSGNPVFYDLELGVKETAEALGVEVQWVAPATADAVQQAALIEQLANTGVDAMGVVPYMETIETTMKAVSDQGIYVAEVSGSDIKYDGLSFAVGTDQHGVGRDVGKLACEKLTEDKTYKVAVITDLLGGPGFEYRCEGFYEALDAAGIKYEEVAKLSCEDDINKAVEAVESYTATNEVDVWFFAGGWPLMAETSALPTLKKWHEEEGHWCFSVDAFPPMEAFFDEGICDGCSGQFYYNMGKLTVEYLLALYNGEELPAPDEVLEHDVPFYSSGTLAVPADSYKDVFTTMTPWN